METASDASAKSDHSEQEEKNETALSVWVLVLAEAMWHVWSQEYPGWQGYFLNMVICRHNAQQDGSIPAVQDHKTYSKTQEPGEIRKWAGCVLPHRHVQHTLWPWTRSCPCIPSTDTSWRRMTPPSTWVSLSTKTQVGTNTLTCRTQVGTNTLAACVVKPAE